MTEEEAITLKIGDVAYQISDLADGFDFFSITKVEVITNSYVHINKKRVIIRELVRIMPFYNKTEECSDYQNTSAENIEDLYLPDQLIQFLKLHEKEYMDSLETSVQASKNRTFYSLKNHIDSHRDFAEILAARNKSNAFENFLNNLKKLFTP